MKSEGKNKGFQCPICKLKKRDKSKTVIKKDRELIRGLYIPEPIAHQTLNKTIF